MSLQGHSKGRPSPLRDPVPSGSPSATPSDSPSAGPSASPSTGPSATPVPLRVLASVHPLAPDPVLLRVPDRVLLLAPAQVLLPAPDRALDRVTPPFRSLKIHQVLSSPKIVITTKRCAHPFASCMQYSLHGGCYNAF
jgi:hypothetical protein